MTQFIARALMTIAGILSFCLAIGLAFTYGHLDIDHPDYVWANSLCVGFLLGSIVCMAIAVTIDHVMDDLRRSRRRGGSAYRPRRA